MENLFRWEDGNGHAPGGGTAGVKQAGAWDLSLPTGKHVRGTAADEAAAMEAVEGEYRKYIVRCWAKGSGVRGGWLCPLK